MSKKGLPIHSFASPDHIIPHKAFIQVYLKRIEDLRLRDKQLLFDYLGIVNHERGWVIDKRKIRFGDIADKHQLRDEQSVTNRYRRIVANLREELERQGWLEGKHTPKLPEAAEKETPELMELDREIIDYAIQKWKKSGLPAEIYMLFREVKTVDDIWLKFEGDAKDRYDGNNLYLPTYVDEISSYATFFSANRKPTGIKQNAFIYIAVLTTDNSGRNTPVIIARARTNGYEEGNIATDYMIAQNQWMSIWPNYVRLHNIESLNCNCADGISLMDMLAEVGTSSYPGSKGTSKSLAELSTIHYQKDKLRITEDCMEYLDKRFNELAKKYGVTKYGEESKNTPTFSGRRTITSYMIEIAYRISKDVYKGVISRTKGQRNIAEQSGMNYGSAGDCITNFLAMMNGEKYTRTLNEQHTKYYLENIKYDFGNDALQRAIDACRKHVEYYATLNNGNLNYVERLIEEFETN